MKQYLLDTNVLAAYVRQRPGAVTLVEPWVMRDEAATSIVNYGEVIEYFHSLPEFPAR